MFYGGCLRDLLSYVKASYSALYQPEFKSCEDFDHVCSFGVGNTSTDDITVTDWHKCLLEQQVVLKDSLEVMFSDGSKALEGTKTNKDKEGKSLEKTIGYSATTKMSEMLKEFPNAGKDCKFSEDCLLVFCAQKVGCLDYSQQGVLLPGISQFITVSHGNVWVRSDRSRFK